MIWHIVDVLKAELRQAQATGGKIDGEKVGGKLAAIAETVADSVALGRRVEIEAGFAKLQDLHDGLTATLGEDVENSASYVAGEIGALTDALGFALSRRDVEDLRAALLDEKNLPFVRILAREELRNVDLAGRLGVGEDAVCRRLQALKAAGAIASRRTGREAFSRLSAAARDLLDEDPRLRQRLDEAESLIKTAAKIARNLPMPRKDAPTAPPSLNNPVTTEQRPSLARVA